jgi:hypothetical protein
METSRKGNIERAEVHELVDYINYRNKVFVTGWLDSRTGLWPKSIYSFQLGCLPL